MAGFGAKKIVSWLRFAGGAPSKAGADPTGHTQFLRHRRPEIDSRTAFHLEPVDLIGAWLTGVVAATPASMVLSWLTDNRPGAPCAYHPALLRLADRRASQLPPLRPTGSRVGVLLPERATALGLAAHGVTTDVPVVCGLPDLHTAAIGTGGLGFFEGHLTISTSAWVSAPVSFKKDLSEVRHGLDPRLQPELLCDCQQPGDRRGIAALAARRGAARRRWSRSDARGLRHGDGRGGTRCSGRWRSDLHSVAQGRAHAVEDPNLRASFVNVSISTTRSDLIRAVLEGVAYNARWLLEATESFAGQSLTGLRLFGGAATSDLWSQIYADVIGRT